MNLNSDPQSLVKTMRINQRIDLKQKERLIKASQLCGVSRAEFVRIALENHLNSLGVYTK